jgi:LemA protein
MQAVLNDIEEQISAARRTYNAHVETYNTFIDMIPMNIFAFIFRVKKFKQFEISEVERENKIWM